MRIINASGSGKTFLPSNSKLLAIGLPLIGLCIYLGYFLSQRSFVLNDLPYNIELATKWLLDGALAILAILVLSPLVTERSCYIKLDSEKIIFHNLFLTFQWYWKDIDRLHLGQSIKSPSNIHFLPVLVPMFNFAMGFKPVHLRFVDYAYNEKRVKRINMKPEEDGFVSMPLMLFDDPADIFQTADYYHKEWYKSRQT